MSHDTTLHTGLMQPISLEDFFTLERLIVMPDNRTPSHIGRHHPGLFIDVASVRNVSIAVRLSAAADAPPRCELPLTVGAMHIVWSTPRFVRPLWFGETPRGDVVVCVLPDPLSTFYVPLRLWSREEWCARLQRAMKRATAECFYNKGYSPDAVAKWGGSILEFMSEIASCGPQDYLLRTARIHAVPYQKFLEYLLNHPKDLS